MHNIFSPRDQHPLPVSTEWASFVWIGATTIAILAQWSLLPNATAMILLRIAVLLATAVAWLVNKRYSCNATIFMRHAVQFAALAWWYAETYEFNRLLPNLDHVFAAAEHDMFGCQPSLLFSQMVASPVWSELFYFGYYCYFYMLLYIALWLLIKRPQRMGRHLGILLTAFFFYYVIYIFLPVAGPQYYFGVIDLEQMAEGIYPNLGDYFATHTDKLATPGYSDGIFYRLVAAAQAVGERPTAAFPSSHCGITVMMLMVAWRTHRVAFLTMLPVACLLFCATVYIQAHYLIDTVVGIITAPFIFFCIERLFFGKYRHHKMRLRHMKRPVDMKKR